MSKLYYSIGEVAEMFEVNTSLIRFWEKEFSIIKPKKNKKGNRMFTDKDIENLKRIHRLVKEEGYTLDGAKVKLKESDDIPPSKLEIISNLQRIKKELEILKTQL
ncbi:MAG: MerR family transcriptional regulator [Crocinitomicaceae bacterium]